MMGRGGEGGGTYDESGVLFPVGLGEHHHRVDDLDTGVRVDIDALVIGPTDKHEITSSSVPCPTITP